MSEQAVRDLVDHNNEVLNQALEDLNRLIESVRHVTISAHDGHTIEMASEVLARLIGDQRIRLGPPIP